jgi:hypothetical protein
MRIINSNFFTGLFPLAFTLFVLSSCGPTPPEEAEVRAKIMGKYCGEDRQLELQDSTYRNTRYHVGISGGRRFTEYCKGTYSLLYEDDRWIIRYARESGPAMTTIHNCEQDQVLWSRDDGYVIGEETVTMKDLFEGAPLTKEACGSDL